MIPGAIITVGMWLLGLVWVLWNIAKIQFEARRMARLRDQGDREWADADEDDAALCRTLEEIQSLPLANPWEVV